MGVVTKVGELRLKNTITENKICLFDATHSIPTKVVREFIFNEDDIIAVKQKDFWRPPGYKILIQRLNNTEIVKSLDNYRDWWTPKVFLLNCNNIILIKNKVSPDTD